jgi:hypothetical protein
MYNIKFTCKALTGTKVHSIAIDDSSLGDTWSVIDVGAIKGNKYINSARAKTGITHDLNVTCEDEVKLSIYEMQVDTLDDECPQTDNNKYTTCEIISIDGDDNDDNDKYIKMGDLYYLVVCDTCDECGAKVYDTVNGICEVCQHAKGWL